MTPNTTQWVEVVCVCDTHQQQLVAVVGEVAAAPSCRVKRVHTVRVGVPPLRKLALFVLGSNFSFTTKFSGETHGVANALAVDEAWVGDQEKSKTADAGQEPLPARARPRIPRPGRIGAIFGCSTPCYACAPLMWFQSRRLLVAT